MIKPSKIFYVALLSLFAWAAPSAHAQTTGSLPPWVRRKVETPTTQPAPQPTQSYPAPIDERIRQARNERYGNPDYRETEYRKGHPHGMPPGQAKKQYRRGYEDGRRDSKYDDRRYERRDDDRRNYDHDDDHRGNYKNKGKGKKDKD